MGKVKGLTGEEKVKIILRLLEDKKAQDIVVLDVRGRCNFTDYFVICTAETKRQIKTVAEHLEENLKSEGVRIFKNTRRGGDDDWVVMDCIDVVVHIFLPDTRSFYNLEKLWSS